MNAENKRTRWVNTRFTLLEYASLQELFKQTTCRELSDYIRKTALSKPVNVRYRNQSIDDFLTDMAALQKELNNVSDSYRQAVQRLHTLHHSTEIRDWLIINEKDKTILFRQIETINNRINQLYQLCTQE